jgi:hypothetical protein
MCDIGQPKRSEQIFKQAKWRYIAVFGTSSAANQILKKLCNNANRLQGLACLAGGIYLEVVIR